ncbi:MAG: hypothetical protein KGL11_01555 [Alphaproteobacteria bacterium]|nr:hypothetical protein [Alphaproteobacteria bacterium]
MPRIGLSLALATALAAGIGVARADFEIRYPIVDYREFEFEHNGSTSLDRTNSGKNNNQSYTFEVGYGVTPWWEPELEAPFNAAPGQNNQFGGFTLENTFQLAEQGRYWLDPGFFAEYQHAASRAGADQFTFGPLVQKEWNNPFRSGLNTLHTLNVLLTKQVGRNRNDATPVAIAWQSRVRLNDYFQPGVEYYGAFNNIVSRTIMSDSTHRVGPVIVGIYNMYRYGKVKYEAGYLFGLNHTTERGTVRWRFEYEKPF